MPVSKITDKYQTTVPKEVRKRLSIGPSDSLNWEIREGAAIITPAAGRFERWKGAIKVGQGSVSRDIRKARKLRGKVEL
jgi:AbrB family looped-hinge helix DNA binding protein